MYRAYAFHPFCSVRRSLAAASCSNRLATRLGACAHSCRGHHRQHRLRASLAERIQPQHREQHLASEARLLADQLATFHGTLRENTQRLSGLFEKRFSDNLQLATDQRIDVGGVMTPALMHEGAPLNNDFSVVDDFREMTAGVATVFARTGDDFVRVSTSVTKQDGSRAIGTLLDRQHPAYPLLLSGKQYIGRAFLFDRHYMTQYTPVKDPAGQVIAVLFVGFDYTDAQRIQFDNWRAFASAKPARSRCSTKTPMAGRAGQSAAGRPGRCNGSRADQPERHGRLLERCRPEIYSVATLFEGGPWTVLASMPAAEIQDVTGASAPGWPLATCWR